MNNIWIPAYKILANTVFLDITSFTYDLDSIKLVLTDDNNKKISVEANEVINFSYTNEQALYLNEFNFTSGVDRKDFPHHFFYKVTNSTLIEKLVYDSANLLDAKDVNVNIRMYNFDDVQCTVIPPVAYGFVTGMNLQLC